MKLKKEEVIDVFTRLGFQTEEKGTTMVVSVPTRRLDISIKEDLIEEVGRIYGYEHVQGTLPVLESKEGSYSKKNYLLKDYVNAYKD